MNKVLELASMPKFKVLNNSPLSDEQREILHCALRKILPNIIIEGFNSKLRIAEPYPFSSASVMRSGLVPSGFWEIKAKPRTYIQLKYPFYHCGFCYCGLRGCGLCRRIAEDNK